MSWVVMDPNSLPSSPALRVKVSSTAARPAAAGHGGVLLGGQADGPRLGLGDDALLVALGGLVGEALRQQEVARVARLHPDQLAGLAERLDVVAQDHFHHRSYPPEGRRRDAPPEVEPDIRQAEEGDPAHRERQEKQCTHHQQHDEQRAAHDCSAVASTAEPRRA